MLHFYHALWEQLIETDKYKQIMEAMEAIEHRLQAILKQLNWTEEKLLNKVENVENKIKVEEEIIADDDPLWPDSLPSEKSLILDQNALRKLLKKPQVKVPQKFSELQLNFNREEKLQIYEHVVNCIPSSSNKAADLFEHEKLFGEIVTTQKREKKRRHKYRTIRPTYMEEVRNVVEMQMTALQQYLKSKLEEEKRLKHKNSRRSARKRSRSPPHKKSISHRHRNHFSEERHKSCRYEKFQQHKK